MCYSFLKDNLFSWICMHFSICKVSLHVANLAFLREASCIEVQACYFTNHTYNDSYLK
jgi:hypothetical protein